MQAAASDADTCEPKIGTFKMFYSIEEIRTILDCSYTKAQDIAHMFVQRGQGVHHGGFYRVLIGAFDAWAHIPHANDDEERKGA